MTLRFVHARADELGPYVAGLRALEADIEYPIADGADRFRIDHGERYHPFFSEMGEAHFIVALDGERVVGTVAGVLRPACIRGRITRALYAADMKVAASHRGGGVSRKMLMFATRKMIGERGGLSWRYAYVAAMRGERGDVTRTVRGVHPGKLARAAARLALFFPSPEQLAALDIAGAPPPLHLADGIDLSIGVENDRTAPPRDEPLVTSTAGKKDLRLRSTGGAPWPLVHLPIAPARATPSWAAYLRDGGRAMIARGMAGPACFAVDERLVEHVGWLGRNGIGAGAVCTVYALSLTPRARGAAWIHLATSEI